MTTTYPYESATAAERKPGAWWWCLHHDVLCEPLMGLIENRVANIMVLKPAHEIETRLRAIRPVRGRLPLALATASEWRTAVVDHQPAILTLFRAECPDVNWNEKGLVFGKEA